MFDLLCNPLAILYDIRLSERGIEFVFFRTLVIATVPYENIVEIQVGESFFKNWAAYRFVNRWVTQRYVIRKQKAWFAKEVVVSPQNGGGFIEELKRHSVKINSSNCVTAQ